MSKMPECRGCGAFLHYGPCLCDRCSRELHDRLLALRDKAALCDRLAVVLQVCGESFEDLGYPKSAKKAFDILAEYDALVAKEKNDGPI